MRDAHNIPHLMVYNEAQKRRDVYMLNESRPDCEVTHIEDGHIAGVASHLPLGLGGNHPNKKIRHMHPKSYWYHG